MSWWRSRRKVFASVKSRSAKLRGDVKTVAREIAASRNAHGLRMSEASEIYQLRRRLNLAWILMVLLAIALVLPTFQALARLRG